MTEEKQWYVYLLACMNDSLYTGITNDIEKRMHTHKTGKGSKYVKSKGFKQLMYTIKAADKVEAAQTEYKIKQLERNDKITFFLEHQQLEYSIVEQKTTKKSTSTKNDTSTKNGTRENLNKRKTKQARHEDHRE